jgi:hypothetical protein
MLRCKSLILPLAVASLTPACAGKSLEQAGGSSSGTMSSAGGFAASAGADARGGSDSTGLGGDSVGIAGTSPGGTSGVGGTGGMTSQAGGDAGGACSQYDDEAGTTIQVRLINGTSQPIYLGPRTPGCGSGPGLTVAVTGGAELVPPGFCTPTCEDALLGKSVFCPPVACPINAAITLQSGQSMLLQWSGSYMQSVTLPPECPLPNDGNQCQRVAGVKPGPYTFSSQAGTAIDCTQTGGATCPPCTGDGSNDCYTAGAVVSGTVLSAHADVMLDASYGVGGGGADGGTARAVEVTFKN